MNAIVSKIGMPFLVATLVCSPVLAHSRGHLVSTSSTSSSHATSNHAYYSSSGSHHTTSATTSTSTHHHHTSYSGEHHSHHHKRSTKAKDAFKHGHPCPSTGKTTGACLGYVIDHIVALKHGGKDDASNMQWQTRADAKAKDKWE